MGGILPSRTVKGSQHTKGLTAQPGLQLPAPPPPSGDNCCAIFQRLRQLTGKEKKKVCLTTSLTGGLDKSGAHFKLLLWQKRGGFTDICA